MLECKLTGITEMNPEQYKSARQSVGTQLEAARLLGVARSTVAHRESGKIPITTEAALAIQYLRKRARWKSVDPA